MRGKIFLAFLVFFIICPMTTYSTVITVDFDGVVSGSVIDTAYRDLEVEFVSFHKVSGTYNKSSVFSLERNLEGTTENNIITASPSTDYLNAYYIVVANFLRPVKYVSVMAYPEKTYSASWAWIKAFDTWIKDYSQAPIPVNITNAKTTSGEAEILEISSENYDIYSVAFMGKARRHVYFDNLTYDIENSLKPVPEPSTGILFITTALVFPFFKKRKR